MEWETSAASGAAADRLAGLSDGEVCLEALLVSKIARDKRTKDEILVLERGRKIKQRQRDQRDAAASAVVSAAMPPPTTTELMNPRRSVANAKDLTPQKPRLLRPPEPPSPLVLSARPQHPPPSSSPMAPRTGGILVQSPFRPPQSPSASPRFPSTSATTVRAASAAAAWNVVRSSAQLPSVTATPAIISHASEPQLQLTDPASESATPARCGHVNGAEHTTHVQLVGGGTEGDGGVGRSTALVAGRGNAGRDGVVDQSMQAAQSPASSTGPDGSRALDLARYGSGQSDYSFASPLRVRERNDAADVRSLSEALNSVVDALNKIDYRQQRLAVKLQTFMRQTDERLLSMERVMEQQHNTFYKKVVTVAKQGKLTAYKRRPPDSTTALMVPVYVSCQDQEGQEMLEFDLMTVTPGSNPGESAKQVIKLILGWTDEYLASYNSRHFTFASRSNSTKQRFPFEVLDNLEEYIKRYFGRDPLEHQAAWEEVKVKVSNYLSNQLLKERTRRVDSYVSGLNSKQQLYPPS